jgi:hypothetical protein
MAGTTNHPTMSATILASTKQGSQMRAAVQMWKADLALTPTQKTLVAQWLKYQAGATFEQISGVYV